MRLPESSLADVDAAPGSAGVWGRRLVLAVLLVFVVAGLAGYLGDRTTTTSTVAGGYVLKLEHASAARAGIDVPWEVTVVREGGFDKELELAVTGDYFDIYETQGFAPEPSESTRDGETLYLTFDAPEGEVFTLSYDAYIQPASQLGKDGTLSVLDEEGVPAASLTFETRLLP